MLFATLNEKQIEAVKAEQKRILVLAGAGSGKTKTLLQKIKYYIEATTECQFTTVLLNQYRDGKDSNGWHADNEKELGHNPIIASLSFGAERVFQLKHNTIADAKKSITLEHGSLLLMKGSTQHFWKHQIPKTAKPVDTRINLTFRTIE